MSSGLYSGASGLTLGYALYSSLPSLWGGDVGYSDNFPTPALALDFISYNTLDPRITFSRGSQATLTDSTGKLTYAPNNLLTNSQDFETVSWTKAAGVSVVANTTVAPDGTTTADSVTFATGGSLEFLRTAPAMTVGVTYIYSIYARLLSGSATFTFDVGNAAPSANQTPTSSWQRFFYVFTFSGANQWLDIQTSAGCTIAFWGGQLEQVTYQTTPSTYNSTTPKNLLGFTQEFDNAAWTKINAFVQTNLLLQSQFAASWTSSAATLTANATTAPNGTTTAASLADNATSGPHVAFQTIGTNSGVTYTASVYAKAGTGRYLTVAVVNGLSTGSATATFDLQTGAVTQSGTYGSAATFISASATDVGGGWYRLSVVSSNTTSNITLQICGASAGTFSPDVFGRNSYSGSGSTWLIWGAQLVQGATAGDYQQTFAAAAAVQYTAPDGTLSADKLVENTAASTQHYNYQQMASLPASTYTYSIYVKAGERNKFRLAQSVTTGYAVDFDLGAVTATTVSGGAVGRISSVGNGWYRCSSTFTTSVAIAMTFVIYVEDGSGSVTYTGDGTSGIYVWGAQLSNSASLDPYVYNPGAAPTSTAYYGPRFDYDPVTLQQKGLLIEEQRTNLFLRSEEFETGTWTKSGAFVTANATTSPGGTTNADKLYESAVNAQHRAAQAVTTTNGAAYTYTIYAKAAERTSIWVRMIGALTFASCIVDLTNGAVTSTSGTCSATSVGGGWYRISVSGTADNTTVTAYVNLIDGAGQNTYLGDGSSGLFIYGAQIEAGAFATSYIPTVASTVTRSADVATMTGANFSNWYNQNEGAFVVEFDTPQDAGDFVVSASNGTNDNRIQVLPWSSRQGQIVNGGIDQALFDNGTISLNVPVKVAIAYKANDAALSLNGASPATDASVTVPAVDRLLFGNATSGGDQTCGHFRRITYYPQRLPNATLQGITA